jgi:hypothetical protein
MAKNKFLGRYQARKPLRRSTHEEIRRLNSAFAYKAKLRLEASTADADQSIRRQETTKPPLVASDLNQAKQGPGSEDRLNT